MNDNNSSNEHRIVELNVHKTQMTKALIIYSSQCSVMDEKLPTAPGCQQN